MAQFPDRLRNERFEQGPGKPVYEAVGYGDRTGKVAKEYRLGNDLKAIIRAIRRGDLLPARAYRRGIERDYDELLDLYGIKHLHLGDIDDDVLLFLVEYEDFVVLLQSDGHLKHFDKPVGATLRKMHDSILAHWDKRAQAGRAERVERIKAAAKRLFGRAD
jgi:hypothetical protein